MMAWQAPARVSVGWVRGALDPSRAYTGAPRPGRNEISYVRADLYKEAVAVLDDLADVLAEVSRGELAQDDAKVKGVLVRATTHVIEGVKL